MSKLSSVKSLIDDYNYLEEVLSKFKGEDIQQILMNASKKLSKIHQGPISKEALEESVLELLNV